MNEFIIRSIILSKVKYKVILEFHLLGMMPPNLFGGRRECALSFYRFTLGCKSAKKSSRKNLNQLNQITYKYQREFTPPAK